MDSNRPDLNIIDDPLCPIEYLNDDVVYKDTPSVSMPLHSFINIVKNSKKLQPYQEELIKQMKDFDYSKTEARVLVLMAGYGAGKGHLLKILKDYELKLMDEPNKVKAVLGTALCMPHHDHNLLSMIAEEHQERRFLIDNSETPRVDRPHYRELEKRNINKKRRYK